MNTRNLPLVLPLLAIFGFASMAQAQTSEVINATISFSDALSIDVDENTVDFGTPSVSDFAAGYVESADVTSVSHFGNVAHTILIEADAQYMDALLPGNDNSKAMADISWSAVINAGSPTAFTALTHVSPDEIDDFVAGNYEDNIVLTYRIVLDEHFAPDTYTGSWTLTIVAQ